MVLGKLLYLLFMILLKYKHLNGIIYLIRILYIPLSLMDFALELGFNIIIFIYFLRKEYGLFINAELDKGYSKPSETFGN